MVATTLHFFDLISDIGNQQYLVQKEIVTTEDLNTAWSIEISIKACLAFILFSVAPLISDFFSQPKLTLAIQVIAVVLPIKALKNPALAQLARDFNYKSLAFLLIIQKLLSFAVIMIVVFINTSYWAIIAGDIAAAVVFTIGSYYIVKFLPRWSLKCFKEQWHFSQWLLLRSILVFFRAQLDIGFISKLFGSSQLGGYHMSRELALMPALSFIIPALEPLLAAIAKSKNDPHILAYRIRFSLYCLLLIITPVSIFIWFFSYEIIAVVLGKQWLEYNILLQYFSLIFLTYPMFALLNDSLIALGKVKRLFTFDFWTTLLLAVVLYTSKDINIESFTLIYCITSFVLMLALLRLVNTVTKYRIGKLFYLTIPIIASAYAAAYIGQIVGIALSLNIFLKLTIITITYFTTYSLFLIILYQYLLPRSEEIDQVIYLIKLQWLQLKSKFA